MFFFIKNKSLETSFFTMLSWNVCCVGAGYPITDGGVAPWRYRIDQILEKILQTDADLNCLYETFDYSAAQYLASQLGQKGYSHVYFNIGARAIGVNSGILLASKFEIKNPEFNLFSKETLVGRTEYAAKGVFGFELVSEKKSFARIYATHLQHSEKPSFPTDEEVVARAGQMSQVMGKVEEVAGRCLIVAGDLNLDEKEYEKSFLKKEFSWIRPEDPFKKSWGGDAFCAKMTLKEVSGALDLDYILTLKKAGCKGEASYIETDYDSCTFNAAALSDHLGLIAKIELAI